MTTSDPSTTARMMVGMRSVYKKMRSTRWGILGRLFPGAVVGSVTDTVEKNGRTMTLIRTVHDRAVCAEVFANFTPTEGEIAGFLVVAQMR